MDPIFLVKDEKSQKNLETKHPYENFTARVRFGEPLLTKF